MYFFLHIFTDVCLSQVPCPHRLCPWSQVRNMSFLPGTFLLSCRQHPTVTKWQDAPAHAIPSFTIAPKALPPSAFTSLTSLLRQITASRSVPPFLGLTMTLEENASSRVLLPLFYSKQVQDFIKSLTVDIIKTSDERGVFNVNIASNIT